MAVTTIAQLAAELNRPEATLIEQLQCAGVNKSSPEDVLTEADKERLLDHLRASHGAERKKFRLTRKSTTQINGTYASGEARSIEVHVKNKRVFIKREDLSGAQAENVPAYEAPSLTEGQTAPAQATQFDTAHAAKMRRVAGAKASKAAAAKAREALKAGKARKAAEAADIAKAREAAAAAKVREAATARAREAAEAAKTQEAAAIGALGVTNTAKAVQVNAVSPASASAASGLSTSLLDETPRRRELLGEGGAPEARIAFLSYRREDSSGHAGRLYDRLTDVFGHDQVFMDVDNIPPGEDFIDVIQASVWASSIFLLVIGPRWAKFASKDGKNRLDDPNDFVRLEISSALKRNIRIIPVLVGGARMPDANELPPEIHPITRKQAVEISDGRFRADAERLIKAIQQTSLSRKVGSS